MSRTGVRGREIKTGRDDECRLNTHAKEGVSKPARLKERKKEKKKKKKDGGGGEKWPAGFWWQTVA